MAAAASAVCIASPSLEGRCMFAAAVIRSWRSSASVTIRSTAASTRSSAARWTADTAGGARQLRALAFASVPPLLLALDPRVPALAHQLSPLGIGLHHRTHKGLLLHVVV